MRACRARARICALAVVLVLAASPAGAVDYEYDALGRLTKAIYENGMTITYEHDPAGNIVRREVAAIPLALAVGVLQNPYLTQFLDIHLVSARALDPSTIRLDVAGERVPVRLLDEAVDLWKGDYEIRGTGGAIQVSACATGFVGVEECLEIGFTSGFVTVSDGGTLHSADARMAVHIDSGSMHRDAYVLVLPLVQGAAPAGLPGKSCVLGARPHGDGADLMPAYRVSPPGHLRQAITIEISYAGLELPDLRAPDQLFIERIGEGPLPSSVDSQAQIVRAATSELGDFALRVGPSGTSRPASPRFLQVAQNQPNPFNPRTTIRFELQTRQHVTVTVFDVRGRRLTTLFDAVAAPGFTPVIWDGRDMQGGDVSSGVYFARVQSERSAASIRMVLVR